MLQLSDIARSLLLCLLSTLLLTLSPPASFAESQDELLAFKNRPIGIVRLDDRAADGVGCAAVLISDDLALLPTCADWDAARKREVVFGMTARLETTFPAASRVVEKGRDWMIVEIKNDPQRFFGTVPVDEAANLPQGFILDVVSIVPTSKPGVFEKIYRDCSISSVSTTDRTFSYYCTPDAYGKSPFPEFIFQRVDNELVGIQIGKGEEDRTARFVRQVLRSSRALSRARLAPPGQQSEEIGKLLTCAQAGELASNPEALTRLRPDIFNDVAMVLRACSDQMLTNKWLPPDQRKVSVVLKVIHWDKPTEYRLESLTSEDRFKVAYACLHGEEPQTPQSVLDLRENPDSKVGCSSVSAAFTSFEPILTDTLQQTEDHARQQQDGPYGISTSLIAKAWDQSTAERMIFAKPETKSTAETVYKTGQIYERCMISWDDSFNVHSSNIVNWRWVVKMKKLRHCYKLVATGPIDVKDIAKSYIDECVNSALNDDKVRHIVTLIAGVAADILSAGSSGGSGTAAAVTDYVYEVQDRALSCLTDQKKVQAFVVEKLKGSFGAEVKETSEWIYWDL